MKRAYSPTYVAILDLLFKTKTISMPMKQITQSGGLYESKATGIESSRLNQDFYVAASELWSMCTPHEYYLTGRIATELCKYNSLWYCNPDLKKSSSTQKAIASLIKKNILIKTETTNIYMVNPVYMRRGDFSSVLNTTAALLMNSGAVTTDHVKDCVPVKRFDATSERVKVELLN